MRKLFLLFGLTLILLNSCDLEPVEWRTDSYRAYGNATESEELSYLNAWIMTNDVLPTTSADMYYQTLKNGIIATPPTETDTVLFCYKCSFLKNQKDFWFYRAYTATNYDTLQYMNYTILNQESYAIQKGLKQMIPFSRTKFIVPSKYLFSNYQNSYGIDYYTTTVFDIEYYGKGQRAINNYQDSLILRYINKKATDKKYSVLPSGMIYTIKSKGDTTSKVLDNSTVTVSYKSYYLNGYVQYVYYDSSAGVSYSFRMDNNYTPDAIKAGVKLIGKGGSLIVYARSNIANLGYTSQPQYQPVVFEITLSEIK